MGIHLDGFEDRAAGVLNYVLDDRSDFKQPCQEISFRLSLDLIKLLSVFR